MDANQMARDEGYQMGREQFEAQLETMSKVVGELNKGNT